jgi:plasmid stability protein
VTHEGVSDLWLCDIDDELVAEIRERAAANGRTESEEVIATLERGVELEKCRVMASKGAP